MSNTRKLAKEVPYLRRGINNHVKRAMCEATGQKCKQHGFEKREV